MKISSDIFIKNIRLVFLLGLIIWIGGIFIPVFSKKHFYLTFISEQFYSTVCHQNHSKSIDLNGTFLNVCARCLGIYSGAAFTSIILLFKRRTFKLGLLPLIIFSSPMLFDVLLTQISVYKYSILFALITGLFFGSIVFIYILSVVENSFSEHIKGKV